MEMNNTINEKPISSMPNNHFQILFSFCDPGFYSQFSLAKVFDKLLFCIEIALAHRFSLSKRGTK